MIFTTDIKVRGYHIDFYHHVNNARYLEFLETARWNLLEQEKWLSRLKEQNLGLVIVSITIDYRSPAHMGDVLEVRTEFKEAQAHKGLISQDIYQKGSGKLVAEAKVAYVILDLRTGKVGRLDNTSLQDWRTLIEQ